MLTIIACPRTVEGGEVVQLLIEQMVNSAGAIVAADNNAQARMTLNACPFPIEPITAARGERARRDR